MKYKLTDETLLHNGRTLYRIEALKSFSIVQAGEKGGWVESTDNLSQKGHCWVADEAKVYGWARVYEDEMVINDAEMCDTSKAAEMALICEQAKLSGNVFAYGQAFVTGEFSGNLHLITGKERVRKWTTTSGGTNI